MISRRDALFGVTCVAALATAEALRPRSPLILMPDATLADLIPRKMGEWTTGKGGDFIIPQVPGSLSDRLYNDTLTRRYVNSVTGDEVMLLIAYGRAQSDLLQLHRPESCYPAVGLPISRRAETNIALSHGASLPGVALTAVSGSRTEDIMYWTRLGEYLPRSAGDQRWDRLKAAMSGVIGDGVLVRASIIRRGDTPKYPVLEHFLATLVASIPPKERGGLVGTTLAQQISS